MRFDNSSALGDVKKQLRHPRPSTGKEFPKTEDAIGKEVQR